ncbi:chaplin [Streptomyces sp. NBC_00151]|uniref:chaplin n=1 Tax=Streptomyces sp. NBC_00151 TaxID=2975669 RepID=UPI002DDC7FB5|nr:chaplin family protein [Streptomyces sp. NBC_00151]
MRQNLSRGVVLAAAATGIMSLYASPALADSNTTATASDSPGVASGNNIQVPVNVPLNICGNTVDVVAALNPAFGNSCASGSVSQGRHAAPHHAAQGHGGQPGGNRAEHGGYGGHGSEHAGYGGHQAGGHAREHGGRSGYGGEQGGYGDSRHGRSGYGDSGYGDSRHGHSGHMSPGYGDSGAHRSGWSGASSYGGTHGSPGVLSGDQVAAPVDLPVELCGNALDVIGIANSVFGNSCAHHHAPEGHATTPHHCTPPATPPRTVPQPPKTPVVHTPPVTVHEQPPVHRQYTPPTLAETGGEGVLANAAISVALMTGGALLYRRSRAQSRP